MGFIRSRVAEALRRRFALLPALGLCFGVVLGFALTELDEAVDLSFTPFRAADASAAQSALSTLATATLTVAGISFSVTLVALQLASTQLSPRVLGTFREDLVVQATLAAFLALFAYALVVIGRLPTESPPELALSVALLGALGALGLFVAFVGRMVAGLQSSTVVRRIVEEGRRGIDTRHPAGIGEGAEPALAHAVRSRCEEALRAGTATALRARRTGYLRHIEAETLLRVAGDHDALVVQEREVGGLVVDGEVVGWVVGATGDGDAVARDVEAAFSYGEERTMYADVAFLVRSLADVALRALSPSLNDPTTALNAMGAATDTILAAIAAGAVEAVRVDASGDPRLVARPTTVDELVRVGFEELSLFVDETHPVVARHLAAWIRMLDERAGEAGLDVPSARELSERLTAATRS